MNAIIILLGLLCFTVQCGRGLEVYCEGREAVLRFSFQRRDINVTLQIGNRYPFYSNFGGNGQFFESGLRSKGQIKRFQVKQNDTDNNYNIIVIISNVSREDEGTYISLVYVDGKMVTDLTRRIALYVEYPPGNPHCRYVSPSYIDVIRNTWDIIECTADIGTMLGYIVCFQNNEILPIHGNLVKNSTTLSQRIWVKRDHFFSCCSSDYRHIVDASSCKAFTSPASGKEKRVTNPKLPFVSSTTSNYNFSAENVTTTGILFDNIEYTPSTQTTTIEVILLTTVLLILFMIICLCFKVWLVGHEIKLGAQNMLNFKNELISKYIDSGKDMNYEQLPNAMYTNTRFVVSQSSGVGTKYASTTEI